MREFLETIIRQRFPFPDNHQKALITHGVHIVVCGGVAQVSSASHVVYVAPLDVVCLRLVQPVLGSPVFAGVNRRRSQAVEVLKVVPALPPRGTIRRPSSCHVLSLGVMLGCTRATLFQKVRLLLSQSETLPRLFSTRNTEGPQHLCTTAVERLRRKSMYSFPAKSLR